MSLAYVVDDVFAEHRPPIGHPERPERIAAVRAAVAAAGLEARGQRLPTRAAGEDEIGRVHQPAYVDELIRLVPGHSGQLDADTFFSPGTWDATLKAAGAVIDLTRAVLDGQVQRGLALVRPPGHHAEADRAMGFCLINNVAVGAAAARALGAARVAIVDWDVHHGNGTQHIFEADPSVLFMSVHQYPYYPGTGAPTEIGVGAGRGATVNVGLPAGCGDVEYEAVFEQVFLPALRRFRPDLILISSGFDTYVADPLAAMRVTARGFRTMARALARVSDELCEGRLVCALEGGYDLTGLGHGAVAVLDAFAPAPGRPEPDADEPDGDQPDGDQPDGDQIGPDDHFSGMHQAVEYGSVAAAAQAAIDKTQAALDAAGGVLTP
ncbi:histone deacetylase family protein [Haliangium sp.]|uniref:histone deacetylase family protein n=1 Tax=Haliangium sp. TaxID=2663208 RepID=UPI003D0D36F3